MSHLLARQYLATGIGGSPLTNKQQAAALEIDLIDDEWWIVNHDPVIGPYSTKTEAREALPGLRRFYRDLPDEDPTIEDILS